MFEEKKTRKKQAHMHTFQLKRGCKTNWGLERKIFRCISPDCWFYVRADILVGKRAVCPRCLRPFILTTENLKLRNPHCDDCTKSPRAEAKKVMTQEIQKEVARLLGVEEN